MSSTIAETWLVFLLASLAAPLTVAVALTVAQYALRAARDIGRWMR